MKLGFKEKLEVHRMVQSHATNIKVEPLVGYDNYTQWAQRLETYFMVSSLDDIILRDEKPDETDSSDDWKSYNVIRTVCHLLILGTLSEPVAIQVRKIQTPHELWIELKRLYFRDTTEEISLHLENLLLARNRYTPDTPVREFINQYDLYWDQLQEFGLNTSERWHKDLVAAMSCDQAKKTYFLIAMAGVHPQLVDTLRLQKDLSYREVKYKFLSLPSVQMAESSAQAAAFVSQSKGSNKPTTTTEPKECSYCKKRNFAYKGHTWKECRRLSKAKNTETDKPTRRGTMPAKNPEFAAMAVLKSQLPPTDVSPQLHNYRWVFDTGASSHMTSNKGYFESLSAHRGSVGFGNDTTLQVAGKGTVRLDCVLPDGKISQIRLHDVLYVPNLKYSLLSWHAIRHKGFNLVDTGNGLEVRKRATNQLVIWAPPVGKKLFMVPESIEYANISTYDFWHAALGHTGQSTLRNTMYEDIPEFPERPAEFHCERCALSKSKHKVPGPASNRATRKLELIHSDLSGKFPVPSLEGHNYYITFTDDLTRAVWIYFLSRKSDTFAAIKAFITMAERQAGTRVLRLRTDNGGEYTSKELERYLTDQGIVHERTTPYLHESNGMAERVNQTLATMARSMLLDLPLELWENAYASAVYIKNRLPHAALKDQTPYEAFRGSKPKILHLQPFGRECYIHIPEDRRPAGTKLLPRAEKGQVVGYTDSTQLYKVYIPSRHRVVMARDITFGPLKPEGVTTLRPSRQNEQPTETTRPMFQPTERQVSFIPIEASRPQAQPLRPEASENPTEDHQSDEEQPSMEQQPVTPPADTSTPEPDQMPGGFPEPSYTPKEPVPHHVLIRYDPNFNRSDYKSPTRPPPTAANQPAVTPTHQMVVTPTQPPLITRLGRIVRRPLRYGYELEPHLQDQSIPDSTESPRESDNLHLIPHNQSVVMQEVEEVLDESELLAIGLQANTTLEEPQSYGQALRSPNADHWRKAMSEELEALDKNHTWDVVNLPTHQKVINCKWVYRIKYTASGEIERFKARLVARGDSQVAGIDYEELFAPVVRYDSLRLLLAITAAKGWKTRQLDVKTAFLHGKLKEEISMRLPEGSRIDGKCARLRRCLYGLKQSPREWYARLINYLLPLGFEITAFDPCVLIHRKWNLFLAIYVDDISMFGPQGTHMDCLLKALETEFEIKDLGPIHWLLGMKIEHTDKAISLSQELYIQAMLDKFGMMDCRSVSTPADHNVRLLKRSPDEPTADKTQYQQIIGSLMYTVTCTRPDLAYLVTHLSQFSSDPSPTHMQAVKRVLRYLRKTSHYKLTYPIGTDLSLEAYCDAAYGNCLDTRRSFCGYLLRIGECVISWRSRRQRSVATSTTEAEYMAISMTAKHYLWTTRAITELLGKPIPAAIRNDNTGALDICSNHRINDRSKHIDIHYHWIRELVEHGQITIIHVDTKDNLADICTKPLARPTHDYLISKLLMK